MDRKRAKRLRTWVWLSAYILALFPFWLDIFKQLGAGVNWSHTFQKGDVFVVGLSIILAQVGEVAIVDFGSDEKEQQVASLIFPVLVGIGNALGYLAWGLGGGQENSVVWAAPIMMAATVACGVAVSRAVAGR